MATAARYFDLVLEVKQNVYNHRLRLVESVRIRGIKPTARLFATSPFTVRKWWRRYQQCGLSSLVEKSRARYRQPHQAPSAVDARLVELRKIPPAT